MLNVQKWLIDFTDKSGLPSQESLKALNEMFGIKYTIWDDKLVVLNYSQIDSPKFNNIVKECRSLVLEFGTWDVVSRSFDRFYNYGETDLEVDITKLVAHEKIDGSLIGLFCYKGEWLYRTKSMIMPDTVINNNLEGVTWKQRIEEGLPLDWQVSSLCQDDTYILELTCRENRVVTKYENTRGDLTLLSIRNNHSGDYYLGSTRQAVREQCGFKTLGVYHFDTMEHCLESAKELRNLEEGYVMYNSANQPVMKVKNPAYVAAHRLRGEGVMTEKNVLNLVIMNEVDEYLAIFPEDTERFKPYLQAYKRMCEHLNDVQYLSMTWRGTQKEFAIKVMKHYNGVASMAFAMKKGKTRKEAWERLTENAKRSMILAYKYKGEL